MLQSFGTSPVLAMWQGAVDAEHAEVGANDLVTLAAYGCVLTRVSTGNFLLDLSPTWMDDQDTIIQVMLFDAATSSGWVPIISLLFSSGNGTCLINVKNDITSTPTNADPPSLFNLVVLDATDGVSNIEGGPGNP